MAQACKATRDLEWLVRRPEPGMANISAHLVQHFDELRSLLPIGVCKTDLVGVPDDKLAPELEKRLRRRAEALIEHRQGVARDRAGRAATRLRETSSRGGEIVMLDVGILLGDLLADRRVKDVSFDLDDELRVVIPLRTLVKVRQTLGKRADLVAFVDDHGLHFRWKDGRGGLRLYSQSVQAWSALLPVDLTPPALPAPVIPVVEAPRAPTLIEALKEEPAPQLPAMPPPHPPARSARPPRRSGSWLHEILSNIGF